MKTITIAGKDYDLSTIRGQIKLAEPLAANTTWKVGGPAELFYQPADRQDLINFLAEFKGEVPITWLGLGSNVLIRDGGIQGIVIRPVGSLNVIELLTSDNTQDCEVYQQVSVEAGATCAKFSRTMAQHGLHGAEFLSGIPGSMGGAVTMNAGAFGGECWEHLSQVECINAKGQIIRRDKTEFEIAYRHVALKANENEANENKTNEQEWFLKAWFVFPKNSEQVALAKEKIKHLLEKRNQSQPTQFPNAGSVFKNPQGDYAARLIEQCGLKGTELGGAIVSPKHANFIINQGDATAQDIEDLIDLVQGQVKDKFGISLVREVRILGEK